MNTPEENNGIRINKYLSDSGVCSRREADREIEMGNVTIDGRIAEMGDRVLPGQKVLYRGIPAELEEERILIAFNKPVGIVCTAEKREKDNVIDYINYPKRIYPIGRLDKDSEGLLLLTNQGEIVNKMMRAGNMHEKEYIVTLWKPAPDSLLRGLAGGVPLTELGVTTRECLVERIDRSSFRIVLTQGYNRQIRRMCEYFGYHVKSLQRVRIMNIELGDLEPGKYRDVTEAEYKVLMRLIRDSSNTTVKEAPRKRFRTEKVQGMAEEEMNRRRSNNRSDDRPDRPSRRYEDRDGEHRINGKTADRPLRRSEGGPNSGPSGRPNDRQDGLSNDRPYDRPDRRPNDRSYDRPNRSYDRPDRPSRRFGENNENHIFNDRKEYRRDDRNENRIENRNDNRTNNRNDNRTNNRNDNRTNNRNDNRNMISSNSVSPAPKPEKTEKKVFISNASHDQRAAFEERQRLKAERRAAKEQRMNSEHNPEQN